MESGAKGCEVVVSGKLRGQRAKSMKFVDGLMIHSGDPVNYYVDTAVCHVLLRQGVLGIKVKIMLVRLALRSLCLITWALWNPKMKYCPPPPSLNRRVGSQSRLLCPSWYPQHNRSPWPLNLEFECCSAKTFNKIFLKDKKIIIIISWLQSPPAVILEPKKIKSDTVSTVSPPISHEVMGPDAMILAFWKANFFTLLFHSHPEAL